MMLKKLALPLLRLATVALLFLMPSAFASGANQTTSSEKAGTANLTVTPNTISDPSGWQNRGSGCNNVWTGNNWTFIPKNGEPNWRSGGGNFKVRFAGVDWSFTVYLKEFDPKSSPTPGDETIDSTRIQYNTDWEVSGIDQYVDGTNNEAELYIALTQASPYDDYICVTGFD